MSVDPRAGIADTLFELEQADEAREVIEAIRADGGVTPATALTVAETLVAYGDLRRPIAGPPRGPTRPRRAAVSTSRCSGPATGSGWIWAFPKTSSTPCWTPRTERRRTAPRPIRRAGGSGNAAAPRLIRRGDGAGASWPVGRADGEGP
ncbi:hypothetical protein ACFQX6_38705 [Streptosporangium lutulentum]